MLGSGGFMGDRISQRLREKEGISYGAGSFNSVPYDHKVASWGSYAFFNPKFKDKVIAALTEEITKAQSSGFTQEELDANKTSWLSARKTNLGQDGYLSSTLINNLLYLGIPLEDYDELEGKVKALTLDEVNAVAKKYFSMDKLVFLIAGDFNKKD